MDHTTPTDLGGTPITGRPVSVAPFVERVVRGRRPVLATAAMATIVTALLALGTLAAWHVYSGWQIGWIELTNGGSPLLVQLLPEIGEEPLAEPFAVVKSSMLALPAGDYRLDVNAAGRIGRTYRFAVNGGETQTYLLSLDEGRLLAGEPMPQFGRQPRPTDDPISFAPVTTGRIELTPGKADLIEWTGRSVTRRDAQTGTPVWDSERPALPWRADENGADRLRRWIEYGPMPELVKSAPDLDGDGIGDLVWFSRQMPALLALSGVNGSVLWEHLFELDIAGVAPPDNSHMPGPLRPAHRLAALVDAPSMADLDRDGIPDLVATLFFFELPLEIERRSPSPAGTPILGVPQRQGLARRVIQAVAGGTGRTLWNTSIDSAFTQPSYPAWNRPATILPGSTPSTIAYVDGQRWIRLDAATGKPRGPPIDLGFEPVRPVQYAELDGCSGLDILAMGPGESSNQKTLAAFAQESGRNLWVAPVDLKNEFAYDPMTPPSWPIVVDLDGDGRCELRRARLWTDATHGRIPWRARH